MSKPKVSVMKQADRDVYYLCITDESGDGCTIDAPDLHGAWEAAIALSNYMEIDFEDLTGA